MIFSKTVFLRLSLSSSINENYLNLENLFVLATSRRLIANRKNDFIIYTARALFV